MEGTVTLGVKDPITNVTPSPVAAFYWERDFVTNDTTQDVRFLDSFRYAFLYAVPSNTSDLTPFSFTQLSTNGLINNTRVLVASTSFREKVFYNSTPKIVFRAIHACLLLFTWAFAAIVGILIARYLPLLRSTWEVRKKILKQKKGQNCFNCSWNDYDVGYAFDYCWFYFKFLHDRPTFLFSAWYNWDCSFLDDVLATRAFCFCDCYTRKVERSTLFEIFLLQTCFCCCS
jgi:hypothetical protein